MNTEMQLCPKIAINGGKGERSLNAEVSAAVLAIIHGCNCLYDGDGGAINVGSNNSIPCKWTPTAPPISFYLRDGFVFRDHIDKDGCKDGMYIVKCGVLPQYADK